MKKTVKISVLLLVLLGVIFIVYTQKTKWLPSAHELTLSGNVDIREVNLAFRVAGRVQSVLVDEGDPIMQEGETLALLDTEPLQNTLNEARANLSAAQAQLNLMTAGYRKEDIAQALAQLRAREAQAKNARQMLERQQNLAGTGAVPPTVLDESRAAYNSAQAEVDAARQNYQALKTGFRVEDIEQAQAQVELAQARVAAAELQLKDASLLAPATGTVITRAIEVGSMVAAGTPVFTLSLNNPVWVRAYVEEPYLGWVASGTPVTVSTDLPNGKIYDGVVGFVSPTAEFTPKQVQTQDLRTGLVYRLRVVVQNPDSQLRQGMPVTVKIKQE